MFGFTSRSSSVRSARIEPLPSFPWPGWLADMDPQTRGITLAVIVSLVLHAIVLSIQFKLPERLLQKVKDSGLEVVLVNAKSARKPVDAQAKAQTNLDGGGNTDENRRAKTPLPALAQVREGDQLTQAQRRVQELEAQQQKLLTQMQSQAVVAQADMRSEVQPEPTPSVHGADLANMALAMARMEAQIARNIDEYNKRPRKKFVGARVTEAVEAQYVEDWRQKVERVGNLHYPEQARGRMYGSLILTVEIRADGMLNKVEINRTSGKGLLDEAAQDIVRRAGPYSPFPASLKDRIDILVITRTWTFTNDRMQSE